MNGDITVSSEVGKGTEFKISLPLKIGERKLDNENFDPVDLRNVNVLVVDDNKINRFILSEQLKQMGALPLAATGAKEALQILKDAQANATDIPLAVLDYQMPGIDGVKLMEYFLASQFMPHMKTLVLTSDDSDTVRTAFHRLGVKEVLNKPARQVQISSSLGRLLRTQESRAA